MANLSDKIRARSLVAAHEADSSNVHGVTNTTLLTTSTAANAYADTAGGLIKITPSGVTGGTLNGHVIEFNAASSVSVDGIFDSTYDIYKMIMEWKPSHTSTNYMYWRLRTAESDDTNTVYDSHAYYFGNSSGNQNSEAQDRWGVSGADMGNGSNDLYGSYYAVDIWNPALTQPTRYAGNREYYYTSAQPYGASVGGTHRNSTAFDGLTFYMNTGTFTGSIRFFGYNQ